MRGLIHIYCGDGKGKTTASIGLLVRAVGNHIPVVFAQFMKNDTSSEIEIIRTMPDTVVLHAKKHFGFYHKMSADEKEEARIEYTATFIEAVNIAKEKALLRQNKEERLNNGLTLLILDEILSAYNYNLIDNVMLVELLQHKPDNLEIVLTGRNPKVELIELADYVSEIQKRKHPFDKGITARKGIEK